MLFALRFGYCSQCRLQFSRKIDGAQSDKFAWNLCFHFCFDSFSFALSLDLNASFHENKKRNQTSINMLTDNEWYCFFFISIRFVFHVVFTSENEIDNHDDDDDGWGGT